MERIIRSNAVETSNHRVNSRIVFETSDVREGDTNIKTPVSNTQYWSTSLQKVLDEQPSILTLVILLSSIVFFVIALVWVSKGRIQEVNLYRGKFVPVASLKSPQDGLVKGQRLRNKISPSPPLVLFLTLPLEHAIFVSQGDKLQVK